MTTATEARLPKQVQNAAARARQILEENQRQREKPAAPEGAELIENTEVAIPSLNREPPKGAQPEPVQAAVDEDGKDLAYYKHRALTLDGALRSAKEKHKLVVSDLQSQVSTLTEQLREAKDKLAAATPIALEDYFSSDEIETMGEPEARIIASKMATAVRTAVNAVRAEMKAAAPPPPATPTAPAPAAAPSDDAPDEDPEVTAFWNELTRLKPNWEKINEDSRWKAFCGTRDKASGFTVQQLIDTAQRVLNAAAIAKLFTDFETSLNVVETPPQPPAPNGRNAGGREPGAPPPPRPANGRPGAEEITEHFKNRSLYFNRPEHTKHITDAKHKEFLARLNTA